MVKKGSTLVQLRLVPPTSPHRDMRRVRHPQDTHSKATQPSGTLSIVPLDDSKRHKYKTRGNICKKNHVAATIVKRLEHLRKIPKDKNKFVETFFVGFSRNDGQCHVFLAKRWKTSKLAGGWTCNHSTFTTVKHSIPNKPIPSMLNCKQLTRCNNVKKLPP